MRKMKVQNVNYVRAFSVCAIVMMLTSCSGSQPPLAVPRTSFDPSRLGVPPGLFQAIDQIQPSAHRPMATKGARDLYVSDIGYNAVEILTNNRWKIVGAITDAIVEPDDSWVDRNGNLYVTDLAGSPSSGPGVTEYNKSGSLVYKYGYDSYKPVAVSTDGQGNVYTGDYYEGVDEFAQQSDYPLLDCLLRGVEGVAIDKSGDVFVDLNSSASGGGTILEYRGGLSGCDATVLGATLSFAGGMVIDKRNDIIVCDQNAKTVDVIAPPYTSISRTLGSGYSDPLHVTINQKNDRVYVADVGAWDVQVLSYATGAKIATLNYKKGLSLPVGAVDRKNYVP